MKIYFNSWLNNVKMLFLPKLVFRLSEILSIPASFIIWKANSKIYMISQKTHNTQSNSEKNKTVELTWFQGFLQFYSNLVI